MSLIKSVVKAKKSSVTIDRNDFDNKNVLREKEMLMSDFKENVVVFFTDMRRHGIMAL